MTAVVSEYNKYDSIPQLEDANSNLTGETHTLRLDVAAPSQVQLSRAFEIAVAIRKHSSPTLDESDMQNVRSGKFTIDWHSIEQYLRFRIEVTAPDCEFVGENYRSIRLYRNQDTSTYYFSLVPNKIGPIVIIVSVYQEDDCLKNERIKTVVSEEFIRSVDQEVFSTPFTPQNEYTLEYKERFDVSKHTITNTEYFSSNIDNLRLISLQKRYETAVKLLNTLEEKSAIFPVGDCPAHLTLQIEEQAQVIEKLQREIDVIYYEKNH